MEHQRNICEEIGCGAKCCMNNQFVATGHEVDTLLKKAGAIKVKSRDDLRKLLNGPNGMYYFDYRPGIDKAEVLTNGDCFFLGDDNNCTQYDQRFENCRDLAVGGWSCNKTREENGLVPISSIETR